jgi:DivIVA domain-containing protein
MNLSPLEIRKQEFDRSLRGYNPDEVHAFLRTVASQWEEMAEAKRRLENQVQELENQLQHYKRVEEALQETLEQTRRNADQQIENAKGRAENIIREAKADAREIKQEAEAKRDRLHTEVNDLQNRRGQIVARLRAFLASEMEILRQYQEGDFLVSDDVEDAISIPQQASQPAQRAAPAQLGEGSASPDASAGASEEPQHTQDTSASSFGASFGETPRERPGPSGRAEPPSPDRSGAQGRSAPDDAGDSDDGARPMGGSRDEPSFGTPRNEPSPPTSDAEPVAEPDTEPDDADDDLMNFASAFGDSDADDNRTGDRRESSSGSSRPSSRTGEAGEASSSGGRREERESDRDETSNEEIERIWRLLDDLD